MGETLTIERAEAGIAFSQLDSGEVFDYEARRHKDVVTWLAEVVPGTMRTKVEYEYHDGDLYAEDGGNMRTVFDDAIEHARDMPHSLSFELRRRCIERDEYDDMLRLFDDEVNTIIVISDFPKELMGKTKDFGGYNVSRKQTMLRQITKTKEGLIISSQSLDGSNRQALEAIYSACGYSAQPGELLAQRMHLKIEDSCEQEFLIDKLMGIYDRSLQEQFGGEWYAGRQDSEERDTYDFVLAQDDLIRHYLATTTQFKAGRDEYNLAAAIKDRYMRRSAPQYSSTSSFSVVQQEAILGELNNAGAQASQRGESFSGCGASIGGQEQVDSLSDLFGLGYGSKAEDQYGPLHFKCTNGHSNTRPYGKLIDQCRIKSCKNSVSC